MSRNALDAYYTPPEYTRALLERWQPRGPVAEPCAGEEWIALELRRAGFEVVTGDLRPLDSLDHPGVDVFSPRARLYYSRCPSIITNPPYNIAAPFIRRCLDLADECAALLRLSFLEPCSKREESRRTDLLQRLDRVIVLPRRSFGQGKPGTDSITAAWFIWNDNEGDEGARLEWSSNHELDQLAGQGDLFA